MAYRESQNSRSGKKPASIAIHFVSNVFVAGTKEDNSYPNRLFTDNLKLLYKEKD